MNYEQTQFFGAGCALGGWHGQGLPRWQRTGSTIRRAWTRSDGVLTVSVTANSATMDWLIAVYPLAVLIYLPL